MATSTGTQSPIVKLAIAVGALLLAVGASVAGLQETRLTCTRDACEIVKTYPASHTRHDLRDVHAVEVHQGSGKQRNTYSVAIVDSRGSSTRVHSSGEAGAAAFKRELEEVLAGQRPQLEVVSPPMYWMFAFVAMLALFALFEIREAIRSWGKYAAPARSTAAPGQPGQRRAIVLWLALVALALVVSAAGNCLLDRSQAGTTGRLQLECHHRCEFNGGTCMPGGALDLRLAPGEYPIKVWNPAAPDSWELHQLRVELGQDTHFVCQPSP